MVLGGAVIGAALSSDPRAARASSAVGVEDGAALRVRLLDALASVYSGNIPGIAARVERPGFCWSGAVGSVTLGGDRPLSPDHGFRISSVTKPFTAAVVLRLMEQGRLGLDDSIATYLDRSLVDRLHVVDGVSYGRRITVRMLLNHTSGVYDYATDPAYLAAVGGDPSHRWTAMEQIEFAIRHGRPYFVPGSGFHYSDTGYVLAGQIAERVTREPLHRLTRRLLLDPLRLHDTYTESLERLKPGTPPRAHQYYQTVDTYAFDPSYDLYGGGGLVSSVGDLARFLRGLLGGRVFRKRATLLLMIRPGPLASYGMGLQWFELDGAHAVGHTGFFGAFAAYVPARNLMVASTTNQSEGSSHAPAQEIARVLRENPTR